MFVLYLNYVYSMPQPPFCQFKFVFYTLFHFCFISCHLGGSDYLLILCLTNFLPILSFFLQESMLISAYFSCCFEFRQSSRRFLLQESDLHVTLLDKASALYCLMCII